ncbi:hypothetical protein K490DRAFT_33829 [Saccharata proteae CBS 121410]|uniref:SURP motif domain-containing protein n=1 Tax=Saccharata proteae CBS 121410 TaxID=1314787 RepID=A0A9P4HZV8_9PEZI|nr:hypothetical protein K490DRAFT_33829 [Saccharata proteae CBS 121410]
MAPGLELDESLKPPAGVVLPPADFRNVIERTAGYVVRNGPAFEDRIRAKETGPKFSFLQAKDLYHPYYQWRMQEIREGRGGAIAAGRGGEEAPQPDKDAGPPEPPEYHFSARMPNISAQDLEVVQLTARFVAKNGHAWMVQLSQREAGNFQFDFLRPQHSLNQFFNRLVDQYKELLDPSSVAGGIPVEERLAQLELNVTDRFRVVDSARQRAEWLRFQESKKKKQENDAEAEKVAYAEIDWHDFTVVETITFTDEDEHGELLPPENLSNLQCQSLESKAVASHNMRIEEAMPTADDEPLFNQAAQSMHMPPPAPSAPQTKDDRDFGTHMQRRMPISAQEEEEEQRILERKEQKARAEQAQAAAKAGPGQMRIRNDYVPRAAAKRKNVQMALCPNCRQEIPYDELEQHMKVELLDPRWKEQKAKADARYATTNLSTSDVANNLKRLASARSDVFDGVTGQPISEEEQARRKKAATSYDGQPESRDSARIAQMHGMNIEEQIRQIHQKYK